jgi:hypothetical protein
MALLGNNSAWQSNQLSACSSGVAKHLLFTTSVFRPSTSIYKQTNKHKQTNKKQKQNLAPQ